MTLGSLFDAAGTACLAAKLIGIKPIWSSEIEKFPLKVTKLRFPEVEQLGDITKINGAEITPVDIIVFGSPCQNLSVAGNRQGLNGSESVLFLEAIRVIKEMRKKYGKPTYIVWENVPGAYTSNNGEDFRRVLEEICKVKDETVSIPRPPRKWLNAGSIMGDDFSVSWRTYNAEYFGVAQTRKRIYLVADFGGYRAEKIQFKPESVSGNFETVRQSFRDYQSDLAKSFGVTGRRPYDNGDNDDGRSRAALTRQQNKNSGEDLTDFICENGTRGGKCPLCNEFQGEY